MKYPIVTFLFGLTAWFAAVVTLTISSFYDEAQMVLGLGANIIGVLSIILLIEYRSADLMVKHSRLILSGGFFAASGVMFLFSGLTDVLFYLRLALMGIGVLTLRLGLEKKPKAKLASVPGH